MNIIQRWCAARCGVDCECGRCTAECIPRARLAEAVGVSEHLLWILQNQTGGITHPKIADDIADFIGATPEERDELVHEKHRGTYVPNPKNPALKKNRRAVQKTYNSLGVVAVDVAGEEVARFQSICDAAKRFNCNALTVVRRCNRGITSQDEFEPLGVSFRFLEEWAVMSKQQRRADIAEIQRRRLAKANPK